MVEPDPIVIVIEDDASFRRSTERLIRSVGRYEVRTFAAASEFLRNPRPEAAACVVLDVHLPGLSGLDLQRELVTAGIQIPIIFTTGYGDIPMSVQAMKAGAVELLTKPFCSKDLLDASRWPSDKVMSDMRKAHESPRKQR
jgi:FixJ family two-component response regulator